MRPIVEMILSDWDVTFANPKTKRACSDFFFFGPSSSHSFFSNTFMREDTHTDVLVPLYL